MKDQKFEDKMNQLNKDNQSFAKGRIVLSMIILAIIVIIIVVKMMP